MLAHLPELPTDTLQEQVSLLCSIPNYHWWEYKVEGGGTKSKKTHVRYSQHVLFHPEMTQDDSGHLRSQFLPVSPRNQVVFFSLNHNSKRLGATITHMLCYDRKEVVEDVVHVPSHEDHPPQPKRRRQAARLLKISPQTLCERMNLEFSEMENTSTEDRSLFTKFKHSLATKNSTGKICWRMHSSSKDVIAMSNYHQETGVILPMDFVHVSAFSDEDGNLYVKCSCKIYQRRKRHGQNP